MLNCYSGGTGKTAFDYIYMQKAHTAVQKLLTHASIPYLTAGIFSVMIWLVAFDSTQFAFTQHWYLTDQIPSSIKIAYYFFSVVLAGLVLTKYTVFSDKKNSMLVLLLFIGTVLGHKTYKNYYSHLQSIPKIKHLSKNWTIQGDRIAITGRNFGPAWNPGSVSVGDTVFEVVSWSNNRVVVEQPVTSPGTGKLILSNDQGKSIVVTDFFEMRDPASL